MAVGRTGNLPCNFNTGKLANDISLLAIAAGSFEGLLRSSGASGPDVSLLKLAQLLSLLAAGLAEDARGRISLRFGKLFVLGTIEGQHAFRGS